MSYECDTCKKETMKEIENVRGSGQSRTKIMWCEYCGTTEIITSYPGSDLPTRPIRCSHTPEAYSKFKRFVELSDKEVERGHLVSHPKKFDFAKEHGMTTLDEVHEWMTNTRRDFEKSVIELSEELIHEE